MVRKIFASRRCRRRLRPARGRRCCGSGRWESAAAIYTPTGTARIGDTQLAGPLVPGHEFSGTVETVGDDARDGLGQPLRPGALVAVDPAQSCGSCEFCRAGNPNLCENLHFCGLWPDPGALAQWTLVPAQTCFPVPPEIDATQAALLELLGVAIHAVDLGKLRAGRSVAILGAGPIGLCLLQVAKASGAGPILVTEPLSGGGKRPGSWGRRRRTTRGERMSSRPSSGRPADAAWTWPSRRPGAARRSSRRPKCSCPAAG